MVGSTIIHLILIILSGIFLLVMFIKRLQIRSRKFITKSYSYFAWKLKDCFSVKKAVEFIINPIFHCKHALTFWGVSGSIFLLFLSYNRYREIFSLGIYILIIIILFFAILCFLVISFDKTMSLLLWIYINNFNDKELTKIHKTISKIIFLKKVERIYENNEIKAEMENCFVELNDNFNTTEMYSKKIHHYITVKNTLFTSVLVSLSFKFFSESDSFKFTEIIDSIIDGPRMDFVSLISLFMQMPLVFFMIFILFVFPLALYSNANTNFDYGKIQQRINIIDSVRDKQSFY